MSTILPSAEDRLHKLELELAERKPIERQIQLFVYFLAALSVVVGVFGFKQLSDIDSLIAEEVQSLLPRQSQKFAEYKKLIDETSELAERFSGLFGKYESAAKAFANINNVTEDFDLEGKVTKLLDEVETRSGDQLYEEKWRLHAVATLRLLAETQRKRNFESDFIFNAAQAASHLQQGSLAYELMQVAFTKRPNDAPIQAGRLSAIVGIGDENEVNDAFEQLMSMVVNLDQNSPHIVLSEAWNAAERKRRYEDLIGAIDRLFSNPGNRFAPSYAYFIKAFALTRASRPGDLESAKLIVAKGLEVLKTESPNSVWHDASLREYAKCLRVFESADALRSLVNGLSGGLSAAPSS